MRSTETKNATSSNSYSCILMFVCERERDLFLSDSTMAVTILADSLLISHLINLPLVKPLNKKAIHRVKYAYFFAVFSQFRD